MPMYRVRTIFTGTPVGDGLGTVHFDASAGTPGGAVTAWATFLGNLSANFYQFQDVTVSGEVDLINEVTGALVDSTVGPDFPVATNNTGNALPPATQGFIRMGTGVVVNGRRLRGRFFVPGLCEDINVAGGGIDAAFIDGVNDALEILVASPTASLCVWHRPVDGAGGSKADVTTAQFAPYWAVLKKRRPGF